MPSRIISVMNSILLILLSCTSIVIFFVPFVFVFVPKENDDNDNWQSKYLTDDWLTLLFYLPFVILWSIYLLTNRKPNSAIYKFLLFLAACTTFCMSFMSVSMLSQDLEPAIGVFISLFILPFLAGYMITEHLLKNVIEQK